MVVYVCSPGLDQSQEIARVFHKYSPNVRVIGVAFDTEKLIGSGEFDQIVRYGAAEVDWSDALIVPTGALSTRKLLESGNVTLGKVIMKKEALLVYEKAWMLEQARLAGVPVPDTYMTPKDVKAFPVFFKQKFEQGGGDRGLATCYRDLPQDGTDSLIYQEYIDSRGTYGVGFISVAGKIIASHMHFEAISFPETGGSAVLLEEFIDERLRLYAQRLIAHINYSGWGLIEFKYCPKRRDYVLMEINAKFWASCHMAFSNEPLFLKLLFDFDVPASKVNRILFLNRFVQHGLFFMLRNISLIWQSSVVVYKSTLLNLALQFFPDPVVRLFRAAYKTYVRI